jgi:hypothetical protein
MPRRIALAVALAFTTTVTFVIVAVGWEAGVFGGGGGSGGTASAEEIAGALQYLAAMASPSPTAGAATAKSAGPRVVTEYVYVYEDVPGASAPVPSGTDAGSAAQPTDEPPTPPATERPSATPVEATPLPPTPPPTAEPSRSLPTELEFTGTVTAIEGDLVTWNYGGGALTTRVSQQIEDLRVGAAAKVHAMLVSSGEYVAKEIELVEAHD